MKHHDGQSLAVPVAPVEATLPPQSACQPQALQPVTWQQAMKAAIRDGRQLCQRLGLPESLADAGAEQDFPVFAPLEYVQRMRFGDPQDPLLLQVLGRHEETIHDPAALLDPVGDLAARCNSASQSSAPAQGLLQKYVRRVLMITSGACAVHCRYCFRRHFPYSDVPKGKLGWEPSLQAIAADESIDEVILSGGDPLTVPDEQLRWLLERISDIPHIRRLRFHTRVPVVIPQRVCPSLLASLSNVRPALFMVLHFNHAQEIDQAVHEGLASLRKAGATLMNQAVVLRGVNDTADAQEQLCLALVNASVIPYYLHQLDPVQGATHFKVDDHQAISIIGDLRTRLPGYAVPQLVREIPGEPSKTLVESQPR